MKFLLIRKLIISNYKLFVFKGKSSKFKLIEYIYIICYWNLERIVKENW